MHDDFVYPYIVGYFPIYDDEYGHIHYDNNDDDHALHDTQMFPDLRTSDYSGSKGVRTALGLTLA